MAQGLVQRRDSLSFLPESDSGTIWAGPWNPDLFYSGTGEFIGEIFFFFFFGQFLLRGSRAPSAVNEEDDIETDEGTLNRAPPTPLFHWCFSASPLCSTLKGPGRGKGGKKVRVLLLSQSLQSNFTDKVSSENPRKQVQKSYWTPSQGYCPGMCCV